MTVLVTHGARKNVGDYLIHARGLALLEALRPDLSVRSVARWDSSAAPPDVGGVIMCGGPGITSRMVEETYPMVRPFLAARRPVAAIALGWSGKPAGDPMGFRMSAESRKSLRAVVASSQPVAVRDVESLRILENLGVDGAELTGCTAWYSLADLGAKPRLSREPTSIVVTNPADRNNTAEAVAVLRLIRRRFPHAKRYCVFHRGIRPDRETSIKGSVAPGALAVAARALGFTVVDAGYDLGAIDFYRDADLHVGYRVHAHLAFLSYRRPSILVCEDGRGAGQVRSLELDRPLWAGDRWLVEALDERLAREISAGWPALSHACDTIEATFPAMRAALQRIRVEQPASS